MNTIWFTCEYEYFWISIIWIFKSYILNLVFSSLPAASAYQSNKSWRRIILRSPKCVSVNIQSFFLRGSIQNQPKVELLKTSTSSKTSTLGQNSKTFWFRKTNILSLIRQVLIYLGHRNIFKIYFFKFEN